MTDSSKKAWETRVLTEGTSMCPLLRPQRDIAIIESVTTPLKVNDVPLYKRGNIEKLILHRIVKIKNGQYIIRGDNLYFNETDITDSDIVGVLKGFYRNQKYYECKTSGAYKLYVFYIRVSYPIRCLLRKIKMLLSKIKRSLLK